MHTFRLDVDQIQEDPFAFYPALREQAPVLQTDLGGIPVWVLSRHEDIARALKDTGTFSSRTLNMRTMLHSDPPDQQRLRGMVADMFTRTAVESMAPFIQQRVDELLPALIDAGTFDIVDDFAGPLTVSVIARLLGITVDDIEQLRHLTRLMLEHVRAQRRNVEPAPGTESGEDGLARFAVHIARPGNHDENGVIARLAGLMATGELSEEEYTHYVVLLLIAGHTTTTNLIANAVYLLAQYPEHLTRLRDEPDFPLPFIEEVLRFRPSFQRTLRVTTRDVTIADTIIPAGATVYVLLGSANRDPERIERPEEFDADRRRAAHMSFGHGIHTCLGQWLARLESRAALVALASQIDSVELDPAFGPQHLSDGTGNEFGFVHLPVRLTGLKVGADV